MRAPGTLFRADAATDAELGVVKYLRLRRDSFRIVAPKASKGTALEEERRPDAWTIMDGKALDVEDQPFGGIHCFAGARVKHTRLAV
jgi:hypothetical protein